MRSAWECRSSMRERTIPSVSEAVVAPEEAVAVFGPPSGSRFPTESTMSARAEATVCRKSTRQTFS